MVIYDIAIVGAGPIGLELAAAVKHAGLRYIHLEAQQIGHTISWFAPHTRFFSSNERIAIAGIPLHTIGQSKATREEYLHYLRSVVQIHDLEVRTYEPVTDIRPHEAGFELTTRAPAGEHTYAARNIALSTGGTASPRTLGVPGEHLPHVSHYFEDPHKYFNKRVLIVGGRNSAVEAALRCHHAGCDVAISYRQGQFDPASVKYWLLPEIDDLVRAGRIKAYFNTHLVAIGPSSVRLAPASGEGAGEEVAADFVLLMVGYMADMSLCRAAGVELRQPGDVPVFDERTMQTNIPGVYLAGTIVGGTQESFRVFIENCHVHVDRIVAALTGRAAPAVGPWQPVPQRPEN